jgi:hypothetical protein
MKLKDQARKLIVEKLNIPEMCFIILVEHDLIDEISVRNTLIREEYEKLKAHQTGYNAMYILSAKFNVSTDTVRKVVYMQGKK